MANNFTQRIAWLALAAALAVGAFAIQCFSDNKADVDLWGNVGFVKALPLAPGFLMENTYSFTAPGRPWINHEWFSEYIFYQIYTRFGATGLLALKLLLGGILLTVLVLKARRDQYLGPTFYFYLLAVLSTLAFGFATRPHLFTYVLYALFLLALTAPWLSRPALLLFAPAAVLWTNLHGAFFIGILLLAVWALGEWIARAPPFCRPSNPRRLAGIFAAVLAFLALSLVNPYGWRLWSYLVYSACKPRPYLTEWAPFNLLNDSGDHVDFLVLAVITILGVLHTRRPRHPAHIIVLAISLAAAFLMRRNIPLFALTAGLLAAPHVVSAAGNAVDRLVARIRPGWQAALLGGFAVLCVSYGWSFGKSEPLLIEVPAGRFPVQAMALMQNQRLSGNLLVFFDWAEYAIWKLYPDCKVFLDGRFASAYPVEIIDDYFKFLYGASTWRKAIDNYPADMLLLHTDNPATSLIELDTNWTLVYRDPLASLFLKNSVHQAGIAAIRDAAIPALPSVTFFP